MSDGLPAHLRATTTDRGFPHYPPVGSRTDHEVRVYESSSATEPSVWLLVTRPTGDERDAVAHLTVEDAWRLGEQLLALVCGHYQGDWRPVDRVADLALDRLPPRGAEEDA